MKKYNNPVFIVVIIAMTLAWLTAMAAHAQNVTRNGNTFVEQVDSSKSQGTKTDYLYTDKNGVTDTIYLSKNGSAFIWKTSKKTGNRYRRYLPKVTEELGTKKDDKKSSK